MQTLHTSVLCVVPPVPAKTMMRCIKLVIAKQQQHALPSSELALEWRVMAYKERNRPMPPCEHKWRHTMLSAIEHPSMHAYDHSCTHAVFDASMQ